MEIATRARRRVDVSTAIWVAAAAVMVFMVLVPLLWIFVASVQADEGGGWTLLNYAEAFTRKIYLQPIVNSLVVAAAAAVLATFMGALLSWAVSRTDMPARGFVRIAVFAAFVTPS